MTPLPPSNNHMCRDGWQPLPPLQHNWEMLHILTRYTSWVHNYCSNGSYQNFCVEHLTSFSQNNAFQEPSQSDKPGTSCFHQCWFCQGSRFSELMPRAAMLDCQVRLKLIPRGSGFNAEPLWINLLCCLSLRETGRGIYTDQLPFTACLSPESQWWIEEKLFYSEESMLLFLSVMDSPWSVVVNVGAMFYSSQVLE